MARRKSEIKRKKPVAVNPPRKRQTAATLLLAALVALFVATPLIASETASENGHGLLLIMLWMLLLLGWLLHGVLQGGLRLRFGPTEWMVLLFVAWMAASTLVMDGQGNARAAINGFWRWASLALAFFLTRQLVRSAEAVRAVSLVMTAVAVGLSIYAFYQFFVTVPATQRMFADDPVGAMRAAGFDPQDEVARRMLIDRVMSHEPTATFALTNSLAGFLAAWLTFLIGRTMWKPIQQRGWLAQGAAIGCILILGGCLLLTKSRTGMIASAAGVALYGLLWLRTLGGREISWRWLGVSAAAIIVVCVIGVGLAVAVGGIDPLVISEAPKTLQYRLEYWRATAAMIAEHPLFGCGPGNFQDYYISHQLPQASESVADPHNLFFEVWATGGAPAFFFFLGFLVCVGRRWRSLGGAAEGEHGSASDGAPTAGREWAVYGGAGAGVLLSYPLGLMVGLAPEAFFFLASLPLAIGAAALLRTQPLNATVLKTSLAVAFVVLSINLLAAGGISFPGVAGSWWLLAALWLNLTDSPQTEFALTPRRVLLGLAMATVGMLIFYRTAFMPALTAPAILSDAQVAERLGQPQNAHKAYQQACLIDPWSAVYPARLANFAFRQWRRTHDDQDWAEFERAADLALSRNARSRSLRKSVAETYLQAYALSGEEVRLQQALQQYRVLAELSPNSSYSHAQLAWVLHLAGKKSQAAGEAAEALRLDALNPHADKKLSIYSAPNAPQPNPQQPSPQKGGETLEQVMQRLRSTIH